MVEIVKHTAESFSDAFKTRVVNGVGTEDTIAPKVVKLPPKTKVTPEVAAPIKEEPKEEGPKLSAQTLLEMEVGRQTTEKHKHKT